MLRPKVTIKLLNPEYQHITDAEDINNIYKYNILPVDFESTENREGVTCSFSTIHNRYDLQVGSKIYITAEYLGNSKSKSIYPVMVVTDVSISSDYVMSVTAIDEFSYYSQTLDLIPVSPTTEQSTFIQNKLGVSLDGKMAYKDNLSISELLIYINSILQPYFYNDTQNIFKYCINNEQIRTNKIQPVIPQLNSKVFDLIKVLKENYFIDIYSTTNKSSTATKILFSFITVEALLTIPITNYNSITYITDFGNIKDIDYKYIDNINIVSDSLVYSNPLTRRSCSVGVFNDKVPKGEPAKKQTFYAYYDNKGIAQVTDDKSKLPLVQERQYEKVITEAGDIEYKVVTGDINNYASPIQLYNTVTVNNANIITEDKRKEYTKNLLVTAEYFGYNGSFETFQTGLNVTSFISLKFNNKMRGGKSSSRVSGAYRVKEIVRTFSSDGLFNSITLYNQLYKNEDPK